MNIQRTTSTVPSLPITSSASTSIGVPYGDASAGLVSVPPNSGLTTLTWWASADGVNFYPSGDASATTVAPSTTGCTCAIPAALAGAKAILIVGNTTGSVTLALKS
jgi:hypothetical protein